MVRGVFNLEKSEIYLNNKLPNNLEAEQSVLGSILVDSSCISKVIETLKPEYFYTKQNKEIFVIMIKMSRKIRICPKITHWVGFLVDSREKRDTQKNQYLSHF